MSAPNFQSILDEAPTEIAVVPQIPQGTWNLIFKSWEPVVSSRKGTEGLKLNFTLHTPWTDVDEDDLEAFEDYKGKPVSHTIWNSDYFATNLDKFHVACGLDLREKVSRKQRNDDAINCEVAAYFGHVPDQSGEGYRAEIKKFLPAE